jgi:hypothetical protein
LAGGFTANRIFLCCAVPALCAAGAVLLLRQREVRTIALPQRG